MYPALKTGYTVRHPTVDDIDAIIAVMRDFDIAESDEVDVYHTEDILADWEDLDISKDAWVIHAPGGMLCGYATLTDQEDGYIVSDGYTHSFHYGCGIGTTLVELMEARAAELVAVMPEGTRQVLVNNIVSSSAASRSLLETRGYVLARVYFRMHITLDAPPPLPAWPEGIIVRACDGSPEDIYRAYETIEDGFKDHWAHTRRDFEDWRSKMLRGNFDPALWFLAQDGEQIAGAILCRIREAGHGWIEQLAVRRPWRKQGLGMALLRQAFGAFYQHGILRVGLGVDGQSLTGAQYLYERAGMQVTMRIGRYEKVLRP
ncbi:MAG: hypothetical protein NVSMB27_03380 [Ktedonobacteraceae bacterium]